MGLYDNLLAQERQRVATEAAKMQGSGSVYLAAEGAEQMRQGMRGMLGIEEPAVIQAKALEARQAKLNGIVSKYSTASTRADFTSAFSELMANGFPEEAAKVQEHLKNMPKPKEFSVIEGYEKAKAEGYDKGFMQYQLDLKSAGKDSKSADAIVKNNIYNDFLVQHNGDETKASYAYKKLMDEEEAKKYNPNAFPNISKKLDLTNKELSPIKDDINQTEKIITLLKEAQNGDTIAWNTAAREMAKLVGDSNISSLEVKTVTGGGSFPDRLVNNLSIWATGVPGDKKIDEALNVATVLAKSLQDDYNKIVDKYTSLWKDDMTSDKTISLIVGDKYVTKPTTNNYTPEELAAVIAAKEAELANN